MFFVIWGKIKNNKWLSASLLAGNILLIAVISSIPTYSQAILQRIYIKTLEHSQADSGMFPGLVQIHFSKLGYSANADKRSDILRINDIVLNELEPDFGAPALLRVARSNTAAWRMTPVIERGDSSNLSFRLEGMTGFKDAVDVVAGRMASSTLLPWEHGELPQPEAEEAIATAHKEEVITPAHIIEVMAYEDLLMRSGLLLGEEFIIKNMCDPEGRPYAIRISGVFRAAPGTGLYWGPNQYSMRSSLFVDYQLYLELFLAGAGDAEYISDFHWDTSLDYHAFQASEVERLLKTSRRYTAAAPSANYRYADFFTKTAESYVNKSRQLNLTLWVLVAPILVLLAFFVSMVSRRIISLDENEISVIKSRGATSKQVFLIYLGMSLLLAMAALAAGIPLGYATCGVIGASGGFLEFVSRAGLRLKPGLDAFAFSAAAAAATVAAMAIPALRASRATIVARKQGAMIKKRPFWRVIFLDIVLLAFSTYELYVYSNQKELLASRAAAGASVDPLLFISSSLFMLGAALLFVRLMSHAVRFIYLAGRKIWPPSLYASLLRVIRASGEEQFIMVFLVLTLATGVFDARVARTVNLNNEHSIRYAAGADITLKEEWLINTRHSVAEVNEGGGVTYKEIVWHEPDFSRYRSLAGAESVTKVYRTNLAAVQSVKTVSGGVLLMGIISDEFGRTAWMRDDLLPSHINNYLNALAQNPDAVVVSSNFRDIQNKKLGDRISYSAEKKNFMGVICGFVDYWPGYDPKVERREPSGAIALDERYLVVANLAKMQRSQGVLPYEVWIKAKGGDTGFIYGEISGGALAGVKLDKFADIRTKFVDAKNDPVFQGTNGVLTIGFLAILLVCAAGFLIYWVLSIRSRELQFGIFRAMGLGMKSVFAMLACEQALISGASILAGIGAGTLVSDHFVSLIQIGYSTGSRLPLITASDALDTARLFAAMGMTLAVCMAVLGATVRRIRIAQAIKLGEE